MDEIEVLRERRKELWSGLVESHERLARSKALLLDCEEEYKKIKKQYEDVDKRLALLDGRKTIALPKERQPRPKSISSVTVDDLSQAQVDELLRRFGSKTKEKDNDT